MHKHIRILDVVAYKVTALIEIAIEIEFFCILCHYPLGIVMPIYQSCHCGINTDIACVDDCHYCIDTVFA